MFRRFKTGTFALGAFSPILVLAANADAQPTDAPSKVVTANQAAPTRGDWGEILTYYHGETRGTRDVYVGIATIKPSSEPHPAHVHAEEEYLLITEGTGTWTLKDKSFPAKAGDMLYAAPWDYHGIRNTGSTTLKFVVWKWNAKGLPVPRQAEPAK